MTLSVLLYLINVFIKMKQQKNHYYLQRAFFENVVMKQTWSYIFILSIYI